MAIQRFIPHPLLIPGYAQTMFAAIWPHAAPVEPSSTEWVTLRDGDQLRLDLDLPNEDDPKSPLVILLHGTGGSGDDSLIIRQAQKLRLLGYTAVRFHHRGCGPGSERRVTCVYHAGRLTDLVDTLDHLDARWPGRMCLLVGYSFSGNMTQLHSPYVHPLSLKWRRGP
jgi:predicted alpha/beta-fold hydrolase